MSSITLKKQTDPTFTVDVVISVPGKAVGPKLETEFKYLGRTALKQFWAELGSGKSDAEALAEIIVGFKGYEKPYSREVLEEVLETYPASAFDFFATFRRELMESKQKN